MYYNFVGINDRKYKRGQESQCLGSAVDTAPGFDLTPGMIIGEIFNSKLKMHHILGLNFQIQYQYQVMSGLSPSGRETITWYVTTQFTDVYICVTKPR